MNFKKAAIHQMKLMMIQRKLDVDPFSEFMQKIIMQKQMAVLAKIEVSNDIDY